LGPAEGFVAAAERPRRAVGLLRRGICRVRRRIAGPFAGPGGGTRSARRPQNAGSAALAGLGRRPRRLVGRAALMYDGRRADKQGIDMPSKRLTSLLAGGLLVGAAASLHAQSLGDVAKKEEERRKATAPA